MPGLVIFSFFFTFSTPFSSFLFKSLYKSAYVGVPSRAPYVAIMQCFPYPMIIQIIWYCIIIFRVFMKSCEYFYDINVLRKWKIMHFWTNYCSKRQTITHRNLQLEQCHLLKNMKMNKKWMKLQLKIKMKIFRRYTYVFYHYQNDLNFFTALTG